MDFMLMSLGTTVLGILGYIVMNMVVRAPGSALSARFARLTKESGGVIAGKKYSEIVSVCGNPSSVSPTGDGNTLCQWMATGYHVALLFDENNVCLGVSHEAKV